MKIKEVKARAIKDSRKEKTIQVIVKTSKGKFITSAPSGKSKGRFEKKSYNKSLNLDISFINKLDIKKLNMIINYKGKLSINKAYSVLEDIEKIVKNKLGANSLFVLEASMLKAIAKENKKQLFEFLGGNKIPRSVGNAIGGGLHSKGISGRRPDFQEFLFIANEKSALKNIKANLFAYKLVKRELKAKKRNDEGAWETQKSDKHILKIMNEVREIIKKKYNKKIDIGIDIAASSFCNSGRCFYQRSYKNLSRKEQVKYIQDLISINKIFYIEDPLPENDFKGFSELLKKTKNKCLIVGDDLTATNPRRLIKAIRNKSINAVIVKPNQIGSLLDVKKVIEICKKHNIKTIISHRSGETMDNTIADLAVGWNCDFIKTGIHGSERESKLKRLIEIERKI